MGGYYPHIYHRFLRNCKTTSSVQILNIISNQNKIMNNFSNETIKKTYFASKTISTYLINEKSEYTALGILSAPVILIILLITLYYILCIGGEKIKIINNDGIISVISVIITLVFFALLLNYQQYSY
jgi:hypothetical protein